MRKQRNGFTLIELLAVLVVLAIISLITVPIVLKTVNNIKKSSIKSSVESYERAVRTGIATYATNKKNGYFKEVNNWKEFKRVYGNYIEYKGKDVECQDVVVDENGKFLLSNCKIKLFNNNGQGYSFVENDYGIKEYIAKEYKIGDCETEGTYVTYKNSKYCVIENSPEEKNYVTVMKEKPLSVEEVKKYGKGNINLFTKLNRNEVYSKNGFGFVAFYSNSDCGYLEENNDNFVNNGCNNISYENSNIKNIVDNWAMDNFESVFLVKDQLGYKYRLITYEELINNLGYDENIKANDSNYVISNNNVPVFVTNLSYNYWTMSKIQDYKSYIVDYAGSNGRLLPYRFYYRDATIRPVITVRKEIVN